MGGRSSRSPHAGFGPRGLGGRSSRSRHAGLGRSRHSGLGPRASGPRSRHSGLGRSRHSGLGPRASGPRSRHSGLGPRGERGRSPRSPHAGFGPRGCGGRSLHGLRAAGRPRQSVPLGSAGGGVSVSFDAASPADGSTGVGSAGAESSWPNGANGSSSPRRASARARMFCLNRCHLAFLASWYFSRGSRCSPPGRQLLPRAGVSAGGTSVPSSATV